MPLIEPLRNFYGRYERPISSLSLILGFVFDIITLKRVDTLWENIWILGHLIIVGIFIILIHKKENEKDDEKNPGKAHFWYVNILQFFFGGTLSAYLVFYFRSSDIFTTWPFLLILLFAFIVNESFKRYYTRFTFQISLFFLSIYSFAIFLVPIILHQIGPMIFLFSGILSIAVISLFLWILFYFTKDKNITNKKTIPYLILAIVVLINFLYFTNLIPPIPLSLKDAGIYYSVQKNNAGNYSVTYEDGSWKKYFQLYPNLKKSAEQPIYAFSAIFSPKNLNINIIHEWQHYDENGKKWITEREIKLSVIGGRDGGFRTYSVRSNLVSGKWRVGIKTEQGQTIGYLRFNILSTTENLNLKTMIK